MRSSVVDSKRARGSPPRATDSARCLGRALLSLLLVTLLPTAVIAGDESAQAHLDAGVTFAEQGQSVQAEKEFRLALTADSTFVKAHFNLGVLLHRQERDIEAETSLRAALRLQPEHAKAHYYLGSVYSKGGRRNQALAEYREALRINPDLDAARRALVALGATTGIAGDSPDVATSPSGGSLSPEARAPDPKLVERLRIAAWEPLTDQGRQMLAEQANRSPEPGPGSSTEMIDQRDFASRYGISPEQAAFASKFELDRSESPSDPAAQLKDLVQEAYTVWKAVPKGVRILQKLPKRKSISGASYSYLAGMPGRVRLISHAPGGGRGYVADVGPNEYFIVESYRVRASSAEELRQARRIGEERVTLESGFEVTALVVEEMHPAIEALLDKRWTLLVTSAQAGR